MSIYKKLREATRKIAEAKPAAQGRKNSNSAESEEEGPPSREIPSDEQTDDYIKKHPDVVPKVRK